MSCTPHLLGIGLPQSPYGLVDLKVVIGRERFHCGVEGLVLEDIVGYLLAHEAFDDGGLGCAGQDRRG